MTIGQIHFYTKTIKVYTISCRVFVWKRKIEPSGVWLRMAIKLSRFTDDYLLVHLPIFLVLCSLCVYIYIGGRLWRTGGVCGQARHVPRLRREQRHVPEGSRRRFPSEFRFYHRQDTQPSTRYGYTTLGYIDYYIIWLWHLREYSDFFLTMMDIFDNDFSFCYVIVTETYGYSPVVRIPRGATHIRLTDNSSNYLGIFFFKIFFKI
jgi:hypothetical protein